VAQIGGFPRVVENLHSLVERNPAVAFEVIGQLLNSPAVAKYGRTYQALTLATLPYMMQSL